MNNLPVVNQFEKEINKLGGKFGNFEGSEAYQRGWVLQTMITFPNGYGLSFIKGEGSYGLEAAVITWKDDDWDLCYSTPITDDVLGYLDEDDIVPLAKRVAKLPKRGY